MESGLVFDAGPRGIGGFLALLTFDKLGEAMPGLAGVICDTMASEGMGISGRRAPCGTVGGGLYRHYYRYRNDGEGHCRSDRNQPLRTYRTIRQPGANPRREIWRRLDVPVRLLKLFNITHNVIPCLVMLALNLLVAL